MSFKGTSPALAQHPIRELEPGKLILFEAHGSLHPAVTLAPTAPNQQVGGWLQLAPPFHAQFINMVRAGHVIVFKVDHPWRLSLAGAIAEHRLITDDDAGTVVIAPGGTIIAAHEVGQGGDIMGIATSDWSPTDSLAGSDIKVRGWHIEIRVDSEWISLPWIDHGQAND